MSSKQDKWKKWLPEIKQQIYAVMGSRQIYDETLEIIRTNPTLPKASAFYGALQQWYADSIIMAVRRQIKIAPQAISLARLIDEIRQEPQLISRKYWTDLCRGYVVEEFADRMFDRLVGSGKLHIDPEEVNADLVELRQRALTSERWADKRVAHFDRGSPPQAPTFGELEQLLGCLDRLLRKYHCLLTADNLVSTTPVIQHDWRAVFHHAWLPQPTEGSATSVADKPRT